MDKTDILELFGSIDDKFVSEADPYSPKRKKKRIWRKIILIAAALLLLGATGAGAYYHNRDNVRSGIKISIL